MNIIKRIKSILIEPYNFFENLKEEKGIKTAFLYLMGLSLFGTIFGLIIGQLLQPYSYSIMSKIFGFSLPYNKYFTLSTQGILIFFAIIGYLLGLLLSFIIAGILHVWILVFGGKANYTKTYQLYVYSHTPNYIMGWVPFVSFFIWIYALILLIIGTQKVYDISKTKSILMYVIPVGLIVLFYLLMFGFMIIMFRTNPNIFQGIMSP